MKTLLTIIGITLSSCLFAQPSLEWAAPQVGTTNLDASTSWAIYEDPSGNIYTAGRFTGDIDFDPSPSVNIVSANSSLDIYISKKDALGNLIWVKQFGNNQVVVHQIAGDLAGNIYILGEFQSTVDFDPGPGNTILSSNGGQDVYVLKLDALGNFDWVRSFGGSSFDGGKSLAFNELNGEVLIAGDFNGSVDFDPSGSSFILTSVASSDGYVCSFNTSGDFQWVKQFGGNSVEFFEGIVLDDLGNIYVTGFFYGDIDVDPSLGFVGLTAVGNCDALLCKLQSTGDLISYTQIGGSGTRTQSWDLDVDDDGFVYIAGRFDNIISFTDVNNVPQTLNTNGDYDIFSIKINNSGQIIWATSVGGLDNDAAWEVVSHNGLVYLGGTYSNLVDFDPGPATDNLPNASPGSNAFLHSLNSSGDHLWAYSFGNSGNSLNDDEIFGLHVGNQGDIFATGYFKGTTAPVDLDPGPGFFNVQGAFENNNAFTIKLGCSAVSGIDNITGSCPYTWIDGNTYNSDNNTATWTLTNQYGCDSVVTLNLTVTDAVAPVADIGTLSDITAECEVTSLIAPTATDACAGTVTGTHSATLPITSTTTITWTYDDGNGNTSTQTQELIIDDVTAPVADAGSLSDLTDECEITSLTAPTATDNCAGTITGTHGVTLPITATTTITWTYDDGNGNTSTQTQEVIIDDVTAPVADVASLSDVTAQCEVTSLIAPTATDNCVGSVTVTNDATLPITSTTTITWTYDDGNGNTSTQTQEVIIDDVTAPMADVASLSDVTADCEVTSLTAPTATDNCAGSITGTHNASLPITAQGTTTVTWTYDDGNGNTSTQTQDVVITDVTAPAADLANLADINSECEVTPTAPAATDNCTGAVTGTPDVSFPITATGTTTVTWTYDDGNGNTSTQAQDVIITPIDNSVSVVDDITLSADASGYTYQWVDCENGNAAIAGQTNQTFEATANGSYAVVIDNGDCSVTSTCFDITTVGLDNNEFQTINVFPNPTSGTVTINSSAQFNKVEVVNVMGQVVYTTTLNEVSTHQLELPEAKGVYLIKVSGNNTNNTFRIIKK